MPSFKRKVSQSLDAVREWLDLCRDPYIAFSGGKDSTCVLHLVRSIEPSIRAQFYHDEYITDDTWDYVKNTPNCTVLAGRIDHPGFTSWDYDEKPPQCPDQAIWVDVPRGDNARKRYVMDNGFDGQAIGLRQDEARYRRILLRKKGMLYKDPMGLWACNPISTWSTADVWAYIVGNGIRYNNTYNILRDAGVDPVNWRVGPIVYSLDAMTIAYPQLAQQYLKEQHDIE